ncbi:MAG: glycosyltransferase family 4 protein [Thainema sp.]
MNITIIHEFDGKKYFEALTYLRSDNKISTLLIVESSIIKHFVRSLLRNKQKIGYALFRVYKNSIFRFQTLYIRDNIVILGIPPWDFRMLWYGMISKRNRLIYHTSWPNWQINTVPRQYGLLSYLFRWCWYRVLTSPNTQIVTVVSESAKCLAKEFPQTEIHVIPHVVSPAFSKASANRRDESFGVLFVGELIEKKGVRLLPQLIKRLVDLPIYFGIVGNGPLMPFIEQIQDFPNVIVYGKISDREQLAEIYAKHHTLIVPSQKTSRWEELFGMVIVEAMAAGLPVIASNHIGPRSIITNLQDGFLVPEQSVDKLEECIRHLFAEPLKWQEMSANAKSKAKTYSLESVASQWLQLLAT